MKIVNKKDRIHFFLVGILPIIFVWFIIIVICLNKATIEIVNHQPLIPYSVYTDQELQGNSIASADIVTNTGIVFTYELKEGYAYPFTGISFGADSGMLLIDPNSIFTIELTMESAGVIPIIFNEYTKNTNCEHLIRPVQYELKTIAGQHIYTFPAEKCTVPSWWYKDHHFSEADFPPINFSNIKNICIQNSSLSLLNETEQIIIKDFHNEANTSSWIWIAVICTFCWFVGYAVYLGFQKNKMPVFIPYIATESEAIHLDEWEKIRNFISSNYMNDIDMEWMEKELGIAKHKIALLIKANTTLIFKQYLNQIKVAEAKRLLLETNLPIGEIADQVGFGHLSNFNRVFKQYTGESPSDLKKQLNN
jgi:AraC-like DNA-binding protein